jgi:hypothetical protein
MALGREAAAWPSAGGRRRAAGPKGGSGVAGLRRPIGQLGRCKAFGSGEERGCSRPR